MKKTQVGLLSGILCLSAFSGLALAVAENNQISKAEAAYSKTTLPKDNINLNDCTDSEIRSYYSNLNNLSVAQRQGTNLLKNLKPILSNGQQYFKYDGDIWKMYEITDRDWDKSPAEEIENYNAQTGIISRYNYLSTIDTSNPGPYLHSLYNNRNVENNSQAWYSHGKRSYAWTIEREHIWAKSHGFNDESVAGAMGDPMHLQSGNGYVNGVHSNYFYGNVSTITTNCGNTFDNVKGNYLGKSETAGSGTVFEPQDDDKGDIARAVFYMVARYNNYAGKSASEETFDSGNPNLCLTESISEQSNTGESTATKAYSMGLVQDLLEWNRLDPVDEYEIHRNNLLYRNYNKNRNPFIDFPEWAEYIWGSNVDGDSYSSTPTGYATPSTDTINETFKGVTLNLSKSSTSVDKGSYVNINATASDSNSYTVSWSSSNTSVASVSAASSSTGTNIRINGNKAGSAVISAQITVGTKTITAQCQVTVIDQSADSVTISLNPTSMSLTVGDVATITATVTATGSYTNQVTWSTDNETVADVENGVVTAVSAGNATITCTSNSDPSVFETCDLVVRSSGGVMSATYTPLSSSTLETTGDAPEGSSATYSNTYGKNQMTGGNSLTLTLSGYSGYRVSGLLLSMKSNKNSGAGYMTFKVGSTTISSIGTSSGLAFNNSDWYGSYSQTYVPIRPTVTATEVNNQNLVLSINCTSNSLYFGSLTVDYAVPVSSVSLNENSLELDLNGEDTAELEATINPIYASNQNVSWDSSDDSVAIVNDGYVEALTVGTTTITVTTEDGNKTATCVVTVVDSGGSVDPDPEVYGQGYYTLIDDVNEVTTGKYVIAVKIGSTYYSMSNVLNGGKYSKDATLSVNEYDIITNNRSDYAAFDFAVSNSTTTIKYEDHYISYDSGTSFVYSSSAYTFNISSGTNGSFRLIASTTTSGTTRGIIYRASTYNYFKAFATSNASSGSTEYYDVELFKYVTSRDLVSSFVDANMKMGTIPTSQTSDTGACKGENGYYLTAKRAWNAMAAANTPHTDLQTIFQSKFGDAYQRYLDWAKANYDSNPFDGNNDIVLRPSIFNDVFNLESNNNYLIILIVAGISLIGLATYFILRKKRQD